MQTKDLSRKRERFDGVTGESKKNGRVGDLHFRSRAGKQTGTGSVTGLLMLLLVMATLSSCGTTRYFQVSSEPEGALLLKKDQWTNATPIQTPANEKINFLRKSEEYTFIAMKRGYSPDTVTVNRESPVEVRHRMKRLEGVSEALPPTPDILTDKAFLLPLDVDFVWHKGVGALDKYETDDEQSAKCAEELFRALTGASVLIPLQTAKVLPSFRIAQNEALKEHLFALNPAYLNFYPEPVLMDAFVRAEDLQIIDEQFNTSEVKYLVYVYCKSIRPTAGRIVGNIAAGSLAPVFVPYYNPAVFSLDNSTLVLFYIIDPKTHEVAGIRQIVKYYDIYKSEQIQKLAGEILASLEM